jgi:hypothetical protein
MPDLQTTNGLIGVIAVSSAIQSLFLLGAAIVGYRLYRQATTTVAELESQHVEPLRRQLDAILADVHRITASEWTKPRSGSSTVYGNASREPQASCAACAPSSRRC